MIIHYSHVILLLILASIGLKTADGNWYTGSMTPYSDVANLDVNNLQKLTDEGYMPVKIWAIFRHSERDPGDETTYGIKNTLLQLRSNSGNCHEVNDWIKRIQEKSEGSGEKLQKQKSLTKSGTKTMQNLGSRFGQRFSTLMNNVKNVKDIRIRHTNEERTEHSAKNFVMGLFGVDNPPTKHFEVTDHNNHALEYEKYIEMTLMGCAGLAIIDRLIDSSSVRSRMVPRHHSARLLRPEFEYFCLEWRRKVKVPNKQRLKAFDNAFLPDVVTQVQDKCAFNKRIKQDHVILMYETCAFETAWYGYSAFCSIFSTDSFERILYREDLEFYLNDGYDNSLNGQIACPMMEDVLKFLFPETYGSQSSRQNILLNFSHIRTMVKFMTHLGLFNDEVKLTESDYSLHQYRQWVSSDLAAFGINLQFVLYEYSEYYRYVVLLFNEKIIPIPGCDGEELCPENKFRQLFDKPCDWNDICKPNDKENLEWFKQFKSDKLTKHNTLGAIFNFD